MRHFVRARGYLKAHWNNLKIVPCRNDENTILRAKHSQSRVVYVPDLKLATRFVLNLKLFPAELGILLGSKI